MQKLRQFTPTLRTANTGIGNRLNPRAHGDMRDRKRFYDSALWQRTRQAKLRRDPCCQACAYEGVATEAKHVDHWVSLADGGHPTGCENLVSLCVSHHSTKTRCEQTGAEFPPIVPSTPRQISFA